ncbi:MAG: rhodanese-like domain-containing protein, partial [Vicinamibacterales bacterium]
MMADRNLLIRPAELAQTLDRAQIIDTRPAEDFAKGRIPGAIHLDLWALSLNNTDPAPLESFLWMIAHLFAARGVD